MSEDPLSNPSGAPLPEAALRMQAGGLRRVAHAILGDEHAAEDAVQDAWVAALQRPPQATREGIGVGAWFRQVTRRQALRRRRGDGRRAAREHVAAKAEALGPVDDEVARREVLREVVDAVLGLPEPYQTTVLMRYFEDLSSREIARRTSTTIATVDSRLHRARVLLRERLDAKSGGDRGQWAPALAAWTGWQGGVAGIPAAPRGPAESGWGPPNSDAVTAGGTTMQTKLLLAGGLLAGVGGGTWLAVQAAAGPDEEADRAAPVVSHSDAPEEPFVAMPQAQSASDARVVATSATDEVPALLDAGGRHVLGFSGLVVDPDDQPLAGAKIWVAQPGHPWNLLTATDVEGRFSAGIVSSLPSAELYAFVQHSRAGDLGFRVFSLSEETPSDVRISVRNPWHRLERIAQLRDMKTALEMQRSRSETQSPSEYAAQMQGMEDDLVALEAIVTVDESTGGYARPFSPPVQAMLESSDGYLFSWLALDAIVTADHDEALDALGHELHALDMAEQTIRRDEETRRIREGQFAADMNASQADLLSSLGYFDEEVIEDAEEEILDHNEEPSADSTFTVLRRLRLTGIVRAANGEPAQGAWVRAHGPIDSESTRTDESGAYTLSVLSSGSVTVNAGGGEYGLASTSLATTSGEETQELEWSPELDRGRELTGRLLGAEGQALASWVVEFVTADGRWVDAASIESDGSFALPNLPETEGRLFARPEGSALVLHVVEKVGVDETHLEVVVPESGLAFGLTTLTVQDDTGQLLADVDARFVQTEVGRGSWFVATKAGRLELGSVAGEVELEAGTAAGGYVDLGTLWVQRDGLHELGSIRLPERVDRELATSLAGDTPVRLVRTDLAFPSVLAQGLVDELHSANLPSGTYELQVD